MWALSRIQDCVDRIQNESCLEFFVCVFQATVCDKCAMIGIVCWTLWNRRNKWVWERANGSAFGVHAAAINLLVDWETAQENGLKLVNQVDVWMSKWNKPPAGCQSGTSHK